MNDDTAIAMLSLLESINTKLDCLEEVKTELVSRGHQLRASGTTHDAVREVQRLSVETCAWAAESPCSTSRNKSGQWGVVKRLVSTNSVANDQFGSSVSISGDDAVPVFRQGLAFLVTGSGKTRLPQG